MLTALLALLASSTASPSASSGVSETLVNIHLEGYSLCMTATLLEKPEYEISSMCGSIMSG